MMAARVVLLTLALLLGEGWADGNAKAEDVDTAIIFIADMSISMDWTERDLVRIAHAEAIQSPEVLTAIADGMIGRIAVSYVEFADEAVIVVGWTVVADAHDAAVFAGMVRASTEFSNCDAEANPRGSGCGTGVGEALHAARLLFSELPYRATRLVVDVAGDGTRNIGRLVYAERQALLDAGATINGLPIITGPDTERIESYYATSIIGGPRAFNAPLRAIDQMPMRLREKLVMELW